MLFKKLKEPVATTDLYYDLFEGGYIKPETLLKDKNDIESVNNAIDIVKQFLPEAESSGNIEIC